MTFYCSRCEKVFEEPDTIYEDEEHNSMCEECWHEENEHKQCDNCQEWVKELDDYDLCVQCALEQ